MHLFWIGVAILLNCTCFEMPFFYVSNDGLIIMQMVCSQSSEFRCSNACGNPLACGNHTCRSTCHFVTIPRLVAGEEVYQLDKLSIPPGIDSAEPTDVPEGAWGKYGSSLPHDKSTSNGLTEDDTSIQPDNLKVVDSCEQCRLTCQKVRYLYHFPSTSLLLPLFNLHLHYSKGV